MKHIPYNLYFLFFILSFVIISCKDKSSHKVSESNKKEVVKSKFARNYPDFDPQIFRKYLKTHIVEDSIAAPFYQENEFSAIWVHDTLDTKNLYTYIDILEQVEKHGLTSDYFSVSRIKSITDSIDSGAYSNYPDTLYSKIYEVERLSTASLIKYATGMKYGFVDPHKLFGKKLYDITLLSADSAFYTSLYSEIKINPIDVATLSHPTDSVYLLLQKEYEILKRGEATDIKKITSGSTTFKLGDKSKYISDIAERLIITGEYTPNTETNDSLHSILDETLLDAINTFRRKNSYLEEKEVGKLTIDALNQPISYYTNKIRANMERYRWKRAKPKENKHIEVNVASFMLEATQSDSLPLISRVCVGSVRNKTPLLESNISYLNLNPIWNVPKSIAQNEVAVLQKKDPTYIKRHNMRLFKGGKEIDTESIDWKTVNPAKFPYFIKQDPGYGNSLGLIKFMFNNAHSVYLHDTPSKAAFGRKIRAISHGCVRIQKPFELAFFCTSPSTDLYKDQLLFSVKKEPITIEGKKLLKEDRLKKISDIINIKQDKKISLFIDYYTVFTYQNDSMLYYADDVYGYDDLILRELSI